MLVTAVGDKTFLGQISREVQLEQRDSPLKLRLGKLAKQISVLGYIAAVLVALSYLFHVFLIDSGMRAEVIRLKLTDLNYVLKSLFHAFTLGLTVIVVAVPEGLPMMIAVVLSANVRKMVRDQVLVRKPVGIEAAGSMNLLFTDKTGTLTEGKMSVVEFFRPFRAPPSVRFCCPRPARARSARGRGNVGRGESPRRGKRDRAGVARLCGGGGDPARQYADLNSAV